MSELPIEHYGLKVVRTHGLYQKQGHHPFNLEHTTYNSSDTIACDVYVVSLC